MSAVALPTGPRGEPSSRSEDALLWAGSLIVVLAAHTALGAWLLLRGPTPVQPADMLPVVTIDMAPASGSNEPAVPAVPVAVVPESAAPDPVLEPVPDVPDPVVPRPEPKTRDATPEAAAAASEPTLPDLDIPLPDVPSPAVIPPTRIPAAAPPLAAAPPPRSPPAPLSLNPPRPTRPAARAPSRRERAQNRRERPAAPRQTAGSSGAPRNAAVRAAASGASQARSAAWRSQLVAYLQRMLRYPPGAGSAGAAYVSFAVNRQGRVLTARLARSSGNPTLDTAAMAIFRGAVPAPPPDYAGSLTFNIPIRFYQR